MSSASASSSTWIIEPFPGLRPFEPENSALFFGRDEQTDELLSRLQTSRFLAVVGDSGSGKSSLVRAGLIPALQRGYMADAGTNWQVALFRPGDDPIGNLARALHHSARPAPSTLTVPDIQAILEHSSMGLEHAAFELLPGKKNLLVVADQFEEIFRFKRETQLRDSGDSATAFVKLLLRAAQEEEAPIYVVLTMRSDFLGDCAQFRGLPEALNGGQYLVPRLTRAQKKEVIEGPAAVAGAEFAPMLVQRLLNDVGDNPDQLPILQHLLLRIWVESLASRERGEPVDLTHYEAVGGISQALNWHLESAYQELKDDKPIAKKIFQRLTERGKGDRETRRPTKVSELAAVAGVEQQRIVRVVNKFREPGRTFLTSPDEAELRAGSVIDITHESLIRLWDTLRVWVSEEAESAKLYRRMAESAVESRAEYHDQDLREALAWRRQTEPNRAWAERYNPAFELAIQFLDRSRRKTRAQRLRRSGAIASLCLFAAVALVLSSATWLQRREVRARELLAHAQRLQTMDGPSLEVSTLLAIESLKSKALFDNDFALRQSLNLLPKPVSMLVHNRGVYSLAFSPDGALLATASDDGTARIFETTTGKETVHLSGLGWVDTVAFSPDGRRIATGSYDHAARVFDAASGKEIAAVKHDGPVYAVAFSPDGRLIASASGDGTIRLVDPTKGRQISLLRHDGPVYALSFSTDGRRIVSGGGDLTARVFETDTGSQLTLLKHDGPVYSVAFSPDGHFIATGSLVKQGDGGQFGAARVFSMEQGREIGRMIHRGLVYAVSFSPDGRRLATGSADGTARVFDIGSGNELSRLLHGGPVYAAVFSPDGRWVATASADKTGRIFEASGGKEIARMIHEDKVFTVAFSADGRRVATGSNDHMARVFEAGDGNELARLTHKDKVLTAAFSPDGKLLATGSADNTARVFEAASGKQITLVRHQGAVDAVVFSPDGHMVATGSEDGTARVFEASTGKELARIDHQLPAITVAFSPDNRLVAMGSIDGTARVFEVNSGKEISHLEQQGQVHAVAFSPDSRLVATGGDDYMARVFEAASGKEIAHLAHSSMVRSVAFSPDGRLVASGSYDNTAGLFDAATGQEVFRLPHNGQVLTVGFSPDGRFMATGSAEPSSDGSMKGLARVFDVHTGQESGRAIFDGPVHGLLFSPDGHLLAASSDDQTVQVFQAVGNAWVARLNGKFTKAMYFGEDDSFLQLASSEPIELQESNVLAVEHHPLVTDDLEKSACGRLARNLSREEWKQYLPDQTYHPTCPNLP
ncbi:MAG TPA: PQQ-binding-like beta-propeller repeat protein [Candidatus Angelobacter sp.]|nr:PQQ-binding-like beta-propeller repeat protein [Candidatus Angelobacter sp.]